MEMDKTIVSIITAVLILSFGTIFILNLDNDDTRPEYVKGIAVYINEEGTTGSNITGAIYNSNGYFLGSTNEYQIIGNSWNVLYFSSPVKIDTRDMKYILTVQGDGEISIPSSGNDLIFQNASYGTFPQLNDTTSTDTISIYAVYR